MEEKRLTHEEITKEALEMFAKETANFAGVLGIPKDKPKKERLFVTKQMIDKAKKKLKKLQKRQRKQDKLGVISAESYIAESNELIEKVGQVMLDGVKDIYGNPCVIKPVIKLDVIKLDEFIKFRDKMARPS